MNQVLAQPVARFADLTKSERPQGYAHRRFVVTGPIDQYTDIQLLEYCDYTPFFGGRVHRADGSAVVVVHTD